MRYLIAAIGPVLEYDPVRQHNEGPPELWNDDRQYLELLRVLVVELRVLNCLLADRASDIETTTRTVINLKDHLNEFLKTYAKTLGTAAGYATVGLIAAILLQLGFETSLVEQIVEHVKLPKK